MKKLNFFEKIRIRVFPRYQIITSNCFGFPFVAIDKSSFLYMHEEIIEKEIYKFISNRKTPRILDCGANIGVSLVYFKKLYPSARITAFEPDPDIFAILKKNMEAGNFGDIELINKGLADEEGTVNFFSEGSDGGRIATTQDNNNIVPIKTVQLSQYLDEKIDFLKIDIEGTETEVLIECQEKLHNVDNLFVEYHSFKEKPQMLGDMLNILTANGFRYYIQPVNMNSLHPFEQVNAYLGFDLQLNIFAYRLNESTKLHEIIVEKKEYIRPDDKSLTGISPNFFLCIIRRLKSLLKIK